MKNTRSMHGTLLNLKRHLAARSLFHSPSATTSSTYLSEATFAADRQGERAPFTASPLAAAQQNLGTTGSCYAVDEKHAHQSHTRKSGDTAVRKGLSRPHRREGLTLGSTLSWLLTGAYRSEATCRTTFWADSRRPIQRTTNRTSGTGQPL